MINDYVTIWIERDTRKELKTLASRLDIPMKVLANRLLKERMDRINKDEAMQPYEVHPRNERRQEPTYDATKQPDQPKGLHHQDRQP